MDDVFTEGNIKSIRDDSGTGGTATNLIQSLLQLRTRGIVDSGVNTKTADFKELIGGIHNRVDMHFCDVITNNGQSH